MRYYKQDTDFQLDAVVEVGSSNKRFWGLGSIAKGFTDVAKGVLGGGTKAIEAVGKAGTSVLQPVGKLFEPIGKEIASDPELYGSIAMAVAGGYVLQTNGTFLNSAGEVVPTGEVAQYTGGMRETAGAGGSLGSPLASASKAKLAGAGAKIGAGAKSAGMSTSDYILAGSTAISAGLQYAGYTAQAKALKDASSQTAQASRNAIAEQRRQYDLNRSDLAPWRQAGREGLVQQKGYLGQMAKLPGYDFQFTANSNTEYPSGSPLQNQVNQANPQDGRYYAGGGGGFNESANNVRKLGGGLTPNPSNRTGLGISNLVGGTIQGALKGNNAQSQPQVQPQQGQPVNQNTGGGLYEDPGYLFRRQEGQRTLNNSMIGRQLGSRATRETQRYGQGLASQEYGQAYNRALNRYNTKYNARYNRLADLSNRWAGRAGVGQSAVNTGVEAGTQTATNIGNIGIQQGQNQANLAMAGGQNYSSFLGNMGNTLNQGYSAYLKNKQFNTTADQNQQYLNNMGKV